MTSKATLGVLNSVLRPSRTLSSPLPRPYPRLPRTSQPAARRFAHAIPKPPSQTSSASASASTSTKDKPRKLLEPHYELTFTCVPCTERSTHVVSKQGYHKGSVLISCPSCRNRHVISDHLNIFGDRKITVEDLMRERGQLVKRGTLGEAGDVEFWEDGTVTDRGAGSGAGAGAGTTAGATGGATDEPDASTEKAEATSMRDARNPSSRSTESAPSTDSVPLGATRARPLVGSSASSHTVVPSTRRQYFTDAPRNEQGQGEESTERPGRDRGGEIFDTPGIPRFKRIRKITGDGNPFTRAEHKLIKSGWRAEPTDQNSDTAKYAGTRSPANRIAAELMRARMQWQHRKSLFPDPTEVTVFSKVGQVITKVPVRDRTVPMDEPQVRPVNSSYRFNGIRFVSFDDPDGRRRYIRTGPGPLVKMRRPPGGPPPPDDSEQAGTASHGERPLKFQQPQKYTGEKRLAFEDLEEYSRASSDLWGNKTVTRKARHMMGEFGDNSANGRGSSF